MLAYTVQLLLQGIHVILTRALASHAKCYFSLHSTAVIKRRYYTVTRLSQSGPRAKRARHQLSIIECLR